MTNTFNLLVDRGVKKAERSFAAAGKRVGIKKQATRQRTNAKERLQERKNEKLCDLSY